jgi:hypothetical protein
MQSAMQSCALKTAVITLTVQSTELSNGAKLLIRRPPETEVLLDINLGFFTPFAFAAFSMAVRHSASPLNIRLRFFSID